MPVSRTVNLKSIYTSIKSLSSTVSVAEISGGFEALFSSSSEDEDF